MQTICSIYRYVGIGLGLMAILTGCAPRYHGPVSDHFNGRRFVNPGEAKRSGGGVLKWLLHRDKGPWPRQPNAFVGSRPVARVAGDSLVLTFVNHSTFLLQTGGLNILTDPVWSRRVGPYNLIGIKRRRSPGLRFTDLPPIDVVLLSHSHYDHLDLRTLRRLRKAHDPLFVTPLGVSYLPRRVGGRIARELDWFDTLRVNDRLGLTCTPARHFSNRGMGDRDRTLWAGYLLHTGFGTVYFGGDSGYGEHFRRIGERAARSASGPVRLALLPIGSYRPQWFMAPVHVSPADAVRAFEDIRSAGAPSCRAVGIHFGTFQQGDDGLYEPADDLRRALRERGLTNEQFVVPQEGKPMVFK